MSQAELVSWFENIVGFLAMPDAELELSAVLSEMDADEELQLLASEFTPEELAEIVEEVFADAGDLN